MSLFVLCILSGVVSVQAQSNYEPYSLSTLRSEQAANEGTVAALVGSFASVQDFPLSRNIDDSCHYLMPEAKRPKALEPLKRPAKASSDGDPKQTDASGVCFPPESIVQHTFNTGTTHTLHAFSGKYVRYEIPESWMAPGALTLQEIRQLVDVTDMLYAQMAELAEGEPSGQGLLRISVNPDDTGFAGLGCVGCKGVELSGGLLSIVKRDVDIETPNAFVYHELAHNFDIYRAYLGYYGDWAHAWTGFFHFYMAYYSRAGDYLGGPEDELERMLSKDIVPWDALGANASWAACVRNGGGCEASGVKANDAWAGLFMRFARLHGTSAVRRVFSYLRNYKAANPIPPPTPEAKNDLFVLALAAGAGMNISCELDTWHWEFSQSVRTQLAQNYPGQDAFCNDGDGDGYSPVKRDYDDNNAAIHPGAVETRNGVDDDCDGVIDDILVTEDGDFSNSIFSASTIESPARVRGQAATDLDYDCLRTNVASSKYIKARLQSLGGFNGGFDLGSIRGGGAGWNIFDFTGNSVTNFDSTVPFGADGLAVVRPASGSSGQYELILDTKAPTPINPVQLNTFTNSTGTVQITATINTSAIAGEQPTEVRFWANGTGFIRTGPIAQSVSFEWTPSNGYCGNGIRAQLLAGDHPISPATSLNPALGNISTRLNVGTGDDVLIAGFIVTGTQAKKIIARAIGPSLTGFPNPLANPILELRNSSGALLDSNDDWQQSLNRQAIIDTMLPPPNNLESAIMAEVPANSSSYTAIVRGVGGGTGTALVEVYDLDRTVDSKLSNISTRGLVQTGDNVMIGGFILSGGSGTNVLVRAIGPTLAQAGVNGALQDPMLELYDASGTRIALNDDWKSEQQQAIINTTLPPTDDRESAILRTLSPGSYTAIVRGKADTTGVALVEVYVLQ